MDAVVNGLIGGSVISLLLVVGGVVSAYSGVWEKIYTPSVLFTWLVILTGLMLGQIYLSYVLVSAFAEAPKQTTQGVVQ